MSKVANLNYEPTRRSAAEERELDPRRPSLAVGTDSTSSPLVVFPSALEVEPWRGPPVVNVANLLNQQDGGAPGRRRESEQSAIRAARRLLLVMIILE